MIKLTDFLKASKVDVDMDSYKVHLATGNPLEAFFNNRFKEWQEYQTKRNFPCEMVVSLIELRRNKWLFAGVYKILGHKKISAKHIDYSTELLAGQDELIGRIVVHHKRTGRPSYLKGKKDGGEFEVSEILPTRLTIKDFPGHNNVCISNTQLNSIIGQGVQTWHGALSNVKGVYLITDNSCGKHYVGSAVGGSGIWQRWSDYARNGHGGNKELRAVLKDKGIDHKINFQFWKLQIRIVRMIKFAGEKHFGKKCFEVKSSVITQIKDNKLPKQNQKCGLRFDPHYSPFSEALGATKSWDVPK